MFAAAYVPDSAVQSSLITRVHNRANLSSAADALPEAYNSTSGARTAGFSKYVSENHDKKIV
jgi:hypothetical protein